LVVQGARLVWVFLEPETQGAPAAAKTEAPVDLAVLERFNPFGSAPSPAATSETAPAAPGLILFGVRSGPGGTAIIGAPGGPQKVFKVGEEVSPGVALAAIAGDHVTLAQGGVRSRLALARPAASESPAGSYTSTPPRAP